MSNERARRKAEMLRADRDEAPEHTPGPWRADGTTVYTETRKDGLAIASTHSVADARLIATAPDLLEALRGLLSASAAIIRYVPADGSEERDLCDAAGDAMIFARAAIARAEGRPT